MVSRQPDGREGAEAELVQNLVPSVLKAITKMHGMEAARAVVPKVLGGDADLVLAWIQHCGARFAFPGVWTG